MLNSQWVSLIKTTIHVFCSALSFTLLLFSFCRTPSASDTPSFPTNTLRCNSMHLWAFWLTPLISISCDFLSNGRMTKHNIYVGWMGWLDGLWILLLFYFIFRKKLFKCYALNHWLKIESQNRKKVTFFFFSCFKLDKIKSHDNRK